MVQATHRRDRWSGHGRRGWSKRPIEEIGGVDQMRGRKGGDGTPPLPGGDFFGGRERGCKPVSFSSLLYPRARNRRIKRVQSRTGSLAIFGTLGFLRGVGGPAQAAWPGETHSAPSADSLLTRLGSGVRTLTHVRRTGPARADGRNCESGTLTGTTQRRITPRRVRSSGMGSLSKRGQIALPAASAAG